MGWAGTNRTEIAQAQVGDSRTDEDTDILENMIRREMKKLPIVNRQQNVLVVNGHAKPGRSKTKISEKQPKRKSVKLSFNDKYFASWKSQESTKQTLKTVLMSPKHKSPTAKLKYAPQYHFPAETYQPTPPPTSVSVQSYKPVFNFLFTERTKPTTIKPTLTTTEATYRPTYRPGDHLTQTVSMSSSSSTAVSVHLSTSLKPTSPSVQVQLDKTTTKPIQIQMQNKPVNVKPNKKPIETDLHSLSQEASAVIAEDNINTTNTAATQTWLEYFKFVAENFLSIFLQSPHVTSADDDHEPDLSPDLASLATVLGLPMLTGSLALAGLGPAVVIAVAWLLPVGALMVVPNIAG